MITYCTVCFGTIEMKKFDLDASFDNEQDQDLTTKNNSLSSSNLDKNDKETILIEPIVESQKHHASSNDLDDLYRWSDEIH